MRCGPAISAAEEGLGQPCLPFGNSPEGAKIPLCAPSSNFDRFNVQKTEPAACLTAFLTRCSAPRHLARGFFAVCCVIFPCNTSGFPRKNVLLNAKIPRCRSHYECSDSPQVSTAQLRRRASPDFFRQFFGLKSLQYVAAVASKTPYGCGHIQDSCMIQTLTWRKISRRICLSDCTVLA